MERRDFIKLSSTTLISTLIYPASAQEMADSEHSDLQGPVELAEVTDLDNLNIGLKRILKTDFEGLTSSNQIAITIDDFVDNGDKVPLNLVVNIPPKELKAVHAFADKNPDPYMHVLSVALDGQSAHEALETFDMISVIRLAEASPVRVVAETHTGELLLASKAVNVGSGGCG